MNVPFSRPGTRLLYVKVPTKHRGGWLNRSTGTADRTLAMRMGRMLEELGPRGKREIQFLDAIRKSELSVAELYDAYSEGADGLEALKRRLLEVDVEPVVTRWLESLRGYVAPDTRKHYQKHVRTLIPQGVRFPSSRLRTAELISWIETIPGKPGTKRKYHAAMSRFCQYLVGLEIINSNPMRNVKPPSPARPRTEYLEHANVLRLVEAQEEPYRTLSALIHGTGMEVSVAIAIRRRDIEKTGDGKWAIVARGTKTRVRTRRVYLDRWAIPYIERSISMLTPDAHIFPEMNRWTPSDVHRAACKRLGIENYTLRDARHTWAVRATRAGASPEIVRRQLGHANTQMVNLVYAPFRPNEEEMTGWHERAEQQDLKNGTR